MPRMQTKLLRSALLVVLSALVLFVAACGGSDDSSEESADLGPDPASMAPADAPFYMEAVVKPSGSLGDDINSALSKLIGDDDPGATIREAIDNELSSDPDSGGITYTDDIEPWLGTRAGLFVSSVDAKADDAEVGFAVAVTDQDAAQSFIDKVNDASEASETEETYNDVTYSYDSTEDTAVGIDGDFLVLGTKQGFEDAVDAGAGESLLDNDDATTALADAPDDSVFSLYVDTQSIVDLIKESGEIPKDQLDQISTQLDQVASGPVGAWGTVTDSSFGLGFSGPAAEGQSGPSDLISTFPADSWLAFASSDVGKSLQTSLDQFTEGFKAGFEASAPPGFDAKSYDPVAMFKQQTGIDLSADLAWIGDAGGFVEGSSILGLGGGLVIEANDEQKATDTVDKLEQALSSNPQLKRQIQVSPNENGFSIQAAGAPVGAEVGVQDGKVVAAAGAATVDDVLNSDDTLDGSDRFSTASDALGDGETPSFFLDFAPVVSLIESAGDTATADPDYQMAKPYIDALDYLVAGGSLDGDRSTGSIVLGVKEGSGGDTDATSATIVP
jgi:hypothetical protein